MINLNCIQVSISKDVNAINQARHLLYKEYIEKQEWSFSSNNPSGIKIATTEEGENLLIDSRDYEAIWFIAYFEKKVIGCGRACGRDSQGKFEIQAYNTGIDFNNVCAIDKYNRMVELTRGVVHPAFRRSGASLKILHAVFEYCQNNELSAFTAPSLQQVINLYKNIGYPTPGNITFRWEPHDTKKALLFLADFAKDDIRTILQNLKMLMQHVTYRRISYKQPGNDYPYLR